MFLSEYNRVEPLELERADDYLSSLLNIQMADTGMCDLMYTNQFFDEAVQLIVNSIRLFQLGYFDTAFYSLRQSLEISIGIIYISEDKKRLGQWNHLRDGFETGRMLDWLKKEEPYFRDMRNKLKGYFDKIGKTKGRINKYVHKQGFQSFYLHNREFALERQKKWVKSVTREFETALKDCIGAVAMYRLAIDAMPAVLMDEDIMMRSRDFITAPYSESFVERYIGKDVMDAYKQTERYIEIYNELSKWERQNPAVFNIIHWQYVERESISEIMNQIELLSAYDRLAVAIFIDSIKVSRVFIAGIHEYTSDVKIANRGTVLGSKYYDELFGEEEWNLAQKHGYLSRVKVNGEYTILEHVDRLDETEQKSIKILGDIFNTMFQQMEVHWTKVASSM